jgi:CRP-like cAMP-binding protein
MPDERNHLAPLTRKLVALATLGDADVAAIDALPYRIEAVESGRHLVREGSAPSDCCVLLEGFACRYKDAASGARQILSFHIPGDILDIQHMYLATADHHVKAISPATVAWTPKAELRALVRERPPIAEALWRDSLIDASIFREWVLNVGRRDAMARISHMICEFVARCQGVGLYNERRFVLPLTQDQIADATGLTAVHVNRTLKALTEEGVLEGGLRAYRVADWKRLAALGEFDPAYLHSAAA